jgi:phosphatidylglycerol lysyltransferase
MVESVKLSIKQLTPVLGLALFGVALYALHHALGSHSYHEIAREIGDIPFRQLLAASALVLCAYLALTGYDLLGLHYIGERLPLPRVAAASFTAYAFSNNIGFAALAGGSVRLRLYSGWGLSAVRIATLVAFASLTFWIGFLALEGAALLIAGLPETLPAPLHGTPGRLIACAMLAVVTAYFVLIAFRKRPFVFRGFEVPLPSLQLAVGQLCVSVLDWALAGAALYVLMPDELRLTYPELLVIFLLAQIVGLLSHVPGGLGVFESVILLLLHEQTAPPAVAAALLAFRLVYYLVPLAIATVILAAHELMERAAGVVRVTRVLGAWATGMLPWVFAAATFASGAILLFSGATPAEAGRLVWLRDVLPLSVMEFSHLSGSLAGAALLLLAWGLGRRLDAAYLLSIGLLTAGGVFSLLKGLDYEEASFVFVTMAALIPCRRHFYRKAALVSDSFSAGWIAAITTAVAGSVWLGLFAHRHVEYSNDLWWQFAFRADAPRFLRASIAVVCFFILIAVYRLLRPALPEPDTPSEQDLVKATAVIARSSDTSANLALLGDKSLLFSDSANTFIMYGVESRSWIALGDPVGVEAEKAELAWRYRELCDRHDGWPVFYEVGTQHLPLYLDLGLSLLKLGEEARVRLEGFSLEGGARKNLRQGVRKLEREGCSFDWVEAEQLAVLLPQLRAISDAWLKRKNTAEKRFSLACFDERYLSHFPMCIVRQHGRIVAFSNVWSAADGEEISPDLMRIAEDAPGGAMDFLFVQMMLVGSQRGYSWFNLGMAPLSGLDSRALAPLWSKVGAFVYRHGEHFYNFQGLRQYKDKFDPLWSPRYLASPGGLALPIILANAATLISGSVKGVFTR